MEFMRVYDAEDIRTHQILAAYLSTFPAEERREKDQFLALFLNPNAEIIALQKDAEDVGYLILWHLAEFVFVEHFEVFMSHRNRKLGSEILKNVQEINPKIILESEPANLNEIATRRIDFYQRNGFSIITEDYLQPAYSAGKSPVQLWLMANYSPESPRLAAENIRSTVYGVQPL